MATIMQDPHPRGSVPPVRRLWGGMYEGGPAPTLHELNRSLSVDKRMWREDIEGSRAWVQALLRADVLGIEEARALDAGLLRVAERIAARFPEEATDEDIHSLVERLLFEEVGDVAGKLHTGRSRNDQVATDARLWASRALTRIDIEVRALQQALLTQAEAHVDVLMPSYTHLRRAQPVRVAHWLLSHFWTLNRDRQRLGSALDRTAVLPLGSGAIAGSGFPVDRTLLKELLGFRVVTQNSIDSVSDRDWICDIIYAASMIGVHLSRLAEDLIIFSTDEFGFVKLPEAFTTGSSLMPQKRNPDGLELARGKSARLLGDLTAAIAMLKSLPSGYNKDMQEDKSLLFDAVDTLFVLLPATRETVAGLVFNAAALMQAADDEGLLATDIADELVRRGMPFREAHGVVGRALRAAEANGCTIGELSDEVLGGVHPLLLTPTRVVVSADASVENRAAFGGTARRQVQTQLNLANRELV